MSYAAIDVVGSILKSGSAIADSWTNRCCIVGLNTSQIAPETQHEICRIISWDLDNLRSGTFASCDHRGNAFPPNSRRDRMKTLPLGCKAVFSYWKGDQEAHFKSHFLTRYYRARMICDSCAAQRAPAIPYSDFTEAAVWRRTLDADGSTQHETSPWKKVAGYRKQRRLYDLMHLVHLGLIRDVIGGLIKETLQSGHMVFSVLIYNLFCSNMHFLKGQCVIVSITE